MCLTHFIGFGSLARSQIKDWKMKRKYFLGKWVKIKSFNYTPAGGSNVTSHKTCLGHTHKLGSVGKLFLCLGLFSCWEKSLFLWNVKINIWHSSCLRGKTRTEWVPFTWKTYSSSLRNRLFLDKIDVFQYLFTYLFICLFYPWVRSVQLYTHNSFEVRLEINIIRNQRGMRKLDGTSGETGSS